MVRFAPMFTLFAITYVLVGIMMDNDPQRLPHHRLEGVLESVSREEIK